MKVIKRNMNAEEIVKTAENNIDQYLSLYETMTIAIKTKTKLLYYRTPKQTLYLHCSVR